MRALLKPRQNRPQDQDEVVTMISRTGGGMVRVQLGAGRIFAVDSWRLYAAHDRSRRISGTELATLPWNGKGADPLRSSSSPRRGEVSAPCADNARLGEAERAGGVMSHGHASPPVTHDPSVGDYADTSPASLGRRA